MPRRPAHPDVHHDVPLHCEDEAGRPMAFIASAEYVASDPYAVWITFHVPGGDVTWLVGRSLLRAGIAGAVGDGDVRCRPGWDDLGHPGVVMTFSSPAGRLVVTVRIEQLLAFLDDTDVVVPAGREHEHLDLDALVAALQP